MLWGLRHCKQHEVENDDGTVTLDRRTHVLLTWRMMRMGVFPYRMYEWAPEEPVTTMTWYWRGRILFSRQVKNNHYRTSDWDDE